MESRNAKEEKINKPVRVRFAPSPTGYLHIGGARTALFNWLFARQNQGTFVLRIEDTDTERLKEDSVAQILNSLRWLGLDWDEGPDVGGAYGPYYQSERQSFYQAAAAALLKEGKAYYCFCSEEELAKEREKQRQAGQTIRYSGKCRHLSDQEVQEGLARGDKPVVRIKLPEKGAIVVQDLIRGAVTFQFEQLDDFIIMKSNGLPAYNFACVVDDHTMAISHVIRAEEHLSNTPKQQFLYEALGYPVPQFAHLSMILAPDRSKLSKRHGATSVSEFREMGCLPEAIVNYLTLLGWSPSEEEGEILTPEQTLRSFSLEKVSKTAAIYDTQKLIWLNGQYLMNYAPEKLLPQALPYLLETGLVADPKEAEQKQALLVAVLAAFQGRVKTLAELPEACRYFFTDVDSYDEKGQQKYFFKQSAGSGAGAGSGGADGGSGAVTSTGSTANAGYDVADLLRKERDCLAELTEFTVERTEKAYRDLIEKLQIKSGQLIHPTRLALTGRTASPGLFEVMALLGKEKCLERLEQAIEYIEYIREHKNEEEGD